jgi:CRISPR-associated protein Cmr4
MYNKACGIIQTIAPLHVGATAGEESGNLNLIFRDQFTQTGIIPGSSIRGRLRSQMRQQRQIWLEKELAKQQVKLPDASAKEITETLENGKKINFTKLEWLEKKAREKGIKTPSKMDENFWYGHDAIAGQADSTTESIVKFEYASIVWLPVFCPGQPIVWVSSPRLLKRYQRIANAQANSPVKDKPIPKPYTASQTLTALEIDKKQKLFFNFGFLTIEKNESLLPWFPLGEELPAVVVADDEIAMIHDMALYRQSRVALDKNEKKVAGGAFFNTEALPEDTILVLPIALKETTEEKWQPFGNEISDKKPNDIYLGGLESIGFGHCEMTLLT